jgi:hypothetical protein
MTNNINNTESLIAMAAELDKDARNKFAAWQEVSPMCSDGYEECSCEGSQLCASYHAAARALADFEASHFDVLYTH